MPSFFDALKDPEFRASVIQGLIDAGNRGAAIVAGAPVDAATQAANLGIAGVGYLGHKAGVLKTPPSLIDSTTVPGSSEWIGRRMEDGGFVSQARNPAAEILASLAVPMAAARVGPSLFAAEQRAAQNLAQPSTMKMQGQRGAVPVAGPTPVLYHGTKAEYEGLPRGSYGGVYYAERPQVAEAYAGPDGFVKKASLGKAKIFDPSKPSSEKILRRIESDYDNATDYRDPDDGAYMPLVDWVRSGYLFKLGRRAQNEVMESLKAEGYDVVRYTDASPMTGDSVSWVVLNSDVLKHAD